MKLKFWENNKKEIDINKEISKLINLLKKLDQELVEYKGVKNINQLMIIENEMTKIVKICFNILKKTNNSVIVDINQRIIFFLDNSSEYNAIYQQENYLELLKKKNYPSFLSFEKDIIKYLKELELILNN